jgi:tRNA dimethylallyltransferase
MAAPRPRAKPGLARGARPPQQPAMRPALVLCGPTASGKSALALALAERLGGTVINADAMQCYRELRVITARPTPEEEARAPHALYGVWPAAEAGSVARWRAAALAAMEAARLPILCGGTGLYLRSLTQGLSAMPEIPEAARREARRALAAEGAAALHARLDAQDRAALRPSDSQRVARATELRLATGRGLVAWQRDAPTLPAAPYAFRAIRLDPPRETLREAIAARWAAMRAAGAEREVAALLAQALDPALPAMRAHGVPELAAWLRGELSEAAADARAVANTIAYVKRQATWWRNQPIAAPAHIIHARAAGLTQFSESEGAEIFAFIEGAR